MKITDPQVIEEGEKDLIEAVREDLDLDAVRQILKERMAVSALSSRGGQIVVHNNKIAFRLDFDINLSGSLLFDREGNYIDEPVDETILEPEMDPEMDPDMDPDMELDGFDSHDTLIHDKLEESLADEIPLVDTGLETDLDETDLDQQDLDDEISIDLPEYDLEDESEYEMELTSQEDLNIQPLDLETDEPLSDESEQLTDEPEIMTESDQVETEELENEDLDDEDLDDDSPLQEEMLDDDILKESREFWEQKKDS